MRTKNSLKNIVSIVVFNLIIGLLGFLKVKVFVNGLSTDIYSLNQLFYQIFGYITIADVGFGLLLNKKLYAAFSKKDKKEINRIFSTSKKFYNFIGIVMLLISFVLSFFVHYFTKANVSIIYIQIILLIFIIRNVIEYFFAAPKSVLEADQKLYKINYLVKGIKIIETLIEMLLVILGVDYLLILIPGIIITLVMNIYINNKIYKMYDWLKDEKIYDKKYLTGTRDVIYQKLSGLVNVNTNVVLLSTFVSPLSVVIYTSYTYVTKFISDTIYLIASAITPSFANHLNKENTEKSYGVFCETNIFFLFLSSFVSIMLYGFLNNLIILWVGHEYLVNNITLFFFCLVTYQTIAQRALVITVNSKGLFKETKKSAIFEAILNISLSLLLIFKYGILGVLIGSVIALQLTYYIEAPIYIYKNIFKKPVLKYYLTYCLSTLTTCLLMLAVGSLALSSGNAFGWIFNVVIAAIIVFIILFIIYMVIFKSFRVLINRGIEFIKVRGKYSE